MQPRTRLPAWRSEFRRDYARLVHSPSFRRLQGKTQLFAGSESDFFRNRLTHSIEVAQIAKAIALQLDFETLREQDMALDLDLVELAALAHDLGHPPFGHTGEAVLDGLMRHDGGFEGNAQTLRILARLEKKLDDDERQIDTAHGRIRWFADGAEVSVGLNLCRRSLAGVLKYDRQIPEDRSETEGIAKGYYSSEVELVRSIRADVSHRKDVALGSFKTIECQIMDLADDIAYSTYDIEDAFKAGLLNPLDLVGAGDVVVEHVAWRCSQELDAALSYHDVVDVLRRIFAAYLEPPRLRQTEASYWMQLAASYRVAKLTAEQGHPRGEFASVRVDRAVRAVSVDFEPADPPLSQVTMEREARLEVAVLKHLVYALLIESPRMKLVARRGTRIVETIFEELVADDGHLLMPPDWIERYEQAPGVSQQKRVVADFIAGMTDRQALDFYSRLTASDFRTMFGLA